MLIFGGVIHIVFYTKIFGSIFYLKNKGGDIAKNYNYTLSIH
jgi:hypothetical protein